MPEGACGISSCDTFSRSKKKGLGTDGQQSVKRVLLIYGTLKIASNDEAP